MKTKFKTGDKVLHNGEEQEVLVSRKDFSNQSIIYKLDSGDQVAEAELKPAKVATKMSRSKKTTVSKKDKLLKERLEAIEEYAHLIEDKEELNEVLIEMTSKEFEKFQEELLEKALNSEG